MTKCKTKKSVSKRFYRRTAGIMIGASPCGVIPLFEELYGCESLHQVHGRLGEFLAHTNSKIKTICYDDACHLVRYARNPKRAEYSEIAKRLSEMEYFVDKIHFLNHVDKFCQEFCNPYTESSGLKEVNTSICEQSFSWMNAFMQVKCMNLPRFFWFFLFNLNMHNLSEIGCMN